MVLLSLAEGTSIITENVFENRFVVVDELNRLGAGIETSGHHAVIAGPAALSGTVVEAPDLRGGAALVTAGLVADGVTEVRSVYHIERGYEDLDRQAAALGADVTRSASERTEPVPRRVSPRNGGRGAQRLTRRGGGAWAPTGSTRSERTSTCARRARRRAAERRAAAGARSSGLRAAALVLWALVAAAAAAAALVYWFYGREMVGNSRAALDLVKLSGKVPGWAVLGAPVIVVAAVALVTVYLAFGRTWRVKLIGVAVVVVVLATPGLAVGLRQRPRLRRRRRTGTAAMTPEEVAESRRPTRRSTARCPTSR